MITRRGVFVVVLGAFTISLGLSLSTYLLIAMGFSLLFLSVYNLPFLTLISNLEFLEVSREIDRVKVFAGDLVFIRVSIKNKSGRFLSDIEIYDGIPEVFDIVFGSNRLRTSIEPEGEITFGYVVSCKLRGKYKIGPTKFIVHDSLGFHFQEKLVPAFTDILVYPSIEDVRRLKGTPQRYRSGIIYGVHKTKVKGIGDDFYGLRKYDVSDELKFIDWKAFSRTLRLYTREFEMEKNIRIMIMLDCSESMNSGLKFDTKLEYSIRAVVFLSMIAMERNDLVGLTAFSDDVLSYIEPKNDKAHIFKILETLALLEAEGNRNLFNAARYVCSKVRKGSLFVIITDLEGGEEDLLNAVKYLRANDQNVVLISPFGPWFEIPKEKISPIDRGIAEAIAEHLWEKRSILIEKLRKMGIEVINVGPDDYLKKVMKYYIRAKKKGIGAV
ncbi:MAG: DUF58 domain-containing protein [Candidatus Asgardarchaeia archaeon]